MHTYIRYHNGTAYSLSTAAIPLIRKHRYYNRYASIQVANIEPIQKLHTFRERPFTMLSLMPEHRNNQLNTVRIDIAKHIRAFQNGQ